MHTTVNTSIAVTLGADEAFAVFIDELTAGLAALGIAFEPRAGGRVVEGDVEVGRVVAWEPGARIELQWRQPDWQAGESTVIAIELTPGDGGTRVTLEHSGWGGPIGDAEELTGWFARDVAAPWLRAMAPVALGDWITDRRARRPSGAQSRAIYADPLYHYPNFKVMLAELSLTPDDYLIEVGCGGGAMLKQALESGCRAAAVDHSRDMVRLAREQNRAAVAAGRLDVRHAGADALPFDDDTFTCAAMTGVFGFLPDPVAALREMRRVLQPGGRLVLMGSDPHLKGTPAAPEPMASRLHFYEPGQLAALAREAGFCDVTITHHDLEQYAREVGVPEEALPLFSTAADQFLTARKGKE